MARSDTLLELANWIDETADDIRKGTGDPLVSLEIIARDLRQWVKDV